MDSQNSNPPMDWGRRINTLGVVYDISISDRKDLKCQTIG